jgi:hypothetical protein
MKTSIKSCPTIIFMMAILAVAPADVTPRCDAAEEPEMSATRTASAPSADKASLPSAPSDAGRWSAEKAWTWYRQQPWLVGCNFVPSTASNDVEMWQAETFDLKTMDRELGWAESLGFNTVRVFLNFVVWEADAEGLKQRFDRFLAVAATHGITVMPVLLDDCNFAGRRAAVGKQGLPVPGVHNSQWVSSPPLDMVTDRAAWPAIEQYIKDFVRTFGQDCHIVVWDLYNEPGNSQMGEKSLPLLEAAFFWAREAGPRQPLTSGPWRDFLGPMSRREMELSDVVSFHCYEPIELLKERLKTCQSFGRPVICTEWMHRPKRSSFQTVLPLLSEQRHGCYCWGLVFGRTQTYMPWDSKPGTPVPQLWQHDILLPDGTPYDSAEAEYIRRITKMK